MAVAFGHDTADLEDVSEVVSSPGGEELAQGDRAEDGVGAGEVEVLGLQVEGTKLIEILLAKCGEFVEELVHGFRLCDAELGFPIVGVEGSGRAMLEDYLYAGKPVGLLAVDEVAEDGVRAPGVGAFVGVGPHVGEIAEEGVEGGGCAIEDRKTLFEKVGFHMVIIVCCKCSLAAASEN